MKKKMNIIQKLVLLILIVGFTSLISMCKNESAPVNISGVKIEDPITLNNENEQILKHYAITIGYNKDTYLPNWVSYLMTRERCDGEFGRENKFSPDPLVADPVLHSDYTKNTYKMDRGHMAPAASMKWNETAMEECFYTSNICPQNRSLNRDNWLDIENFVRDVAMKYDSVYVVTGPIVSSDPLYMGNTHNIAIPDAFYKVLLRKGEKGWTTLAFVCKNEAGSKPILTYITTIDDVEKQAGIDFFHSLPDEVEEEIEANDNISQWTL
jgi:endonuclease G